MSQRTHEIVKFPGGRFSVKPSCAREAMHSSIGPWEEASHVYLTQSGIAQRLKRSVEPLVVYDVGLGIGANALAVLEFVLAQPAGPEIEIVSFENDLAAMELALAQGEMFDFLFRNRAAVLELLKKLEIRRGRVKWTLVPGDFREVLAASIPAGALPAPEVIFYDFYSPAENPELWGLGCMDLLWDVSKPRWSAQKETRLITYCTATAARAAMLLAGFSVGYGAKTEVKKETTVAFTRLADLKTAGVRPLGEEWLQKLARSSKPLPEVSPSRALEKIRHCEQFQA